MNHQQPLDIFIIRLAQKIAALYPNSCANEEDYIQEGHLKLAEIHGNGQKKRNFRAYAIIAIARAMRRIAIKAMYAVSAPYRIKRLIHRIEILLVLGKTENEICQELQITRNIFIELKSLITVESWHRLFNEPTLDLEPFNLLDDLLLSDYLTRDDRIFIQAQFNNTVNNLIPNRKKRWLKVRNLRSKLIQGGYGN